ncbi:uncharacterized protein LOC111056079 isoform X2 [Nilaparvata lugens]|nr:uncharacterized protein LOC111056079 isoform X2 [Nilaparvata lugens]XP_039275165.1 uncharacterized protein LOC111056079 isoform X2 [Nilaparvata lugens]
MNPEVDPYMMHAILDQIRHHAYIECYHSDDSDESFHQWHSGHTEEVGARAQPHRKKYCYKCVDEADEVARQLIEEEKKEKESLLNKQLKKQKKRQKKQRQKQKKKGNQNGQQTPEDGSSIKAEEDEEIDLNSAFINKALEKLNISKQNDTEKSDKKILNGNWITNEDHPVTPLALEAFTCATNGNFKSAIEKYTLAMKVAPEDFRLYINRSFCFYQIKEFQKSLEDAILGLTYAPDYAVGYLRKGEAYLGLGNHDLAEEAFEEVLKYDPQCQEAANDLMFLKVKKLSDMGYSREQASFAMRCCNSIDDAIQFLLDNPDCCKSNAVEKTQSLQDDEIYDSDEEDDDQSDALSMISSAAISSHSVWDIYDYNNDPFTDVANPYKCCELYVGNIAFEINPEIVKCYFERYGTITNFKFMKSSSSALITYANWQSASNAMKSLQNSMLIPHTPKIVIKYPGTKIAPYIRSDINLNKPDPNKLKVTDKNFCSQTMPPPSPTPSLSSVKSTRTEYEDHFPKVMPPKVNPAQDPSNPTNCCSLYVGNIASRIKERNLLDSFSKYGKVVSLRIITDSNCAFLNFENGRSAGNAMRWLQNKSLLPGTPAVVIKYPSKAIATQKSQMTPDKPLACYRWRTAGFCEQGRQCPFPHIANQKGIAMTHKAVKAVTTRRN